MLPARFPPAITSPRGPPSGVKKPPFTAAMPLREAAAACASGHWEPAPPGWSATTSLWLRLSKVTAVMEIPERVVEVTRGAAAGTCGVVAAGFAGEGFAATGISAMGRAAGGCSGRGAQEAISRKTGRIACRNTLGNNTTPSPIAIPHTGFLATASRVWKFGGSDSRSTTAVSISIKPAFSSIAASSPSPKPSQTSA